MARTKAAERVHERIASNLPINSRVAIAVVSDPYSEVGEQIAVIRSVRDDPLADMHSRGVIDDAMFWAGRKWQKLHECSEIGPIGAVDPTREAVDGGKPRDPITDRQIDAFRELNLAHRELGMIGERLVKDILGQGLTIGQVADKWGRTSQREQNYLSRRFRESLETLGEIWGLVGTPRK